MLKKPFLKTLSLVQVLKKYFQACLCYLNWLNIEAVIFTSYNYEDIKSVFVKLNDDFSACVLRVKNC